MSRVKDMMSKNNDRDFERAIRRMEYAYAAQVRAKQKAVKGRR